jgi:hypothetical protein
MEGKEGTLTFDVEEGRWRLGDESLHGGDVLEVELLSGHWVPLRFEWARRGDGQRPGGIFVLGLAGGGDTVLTLPKGAHVREPAVAI